MKSGARFGLAAFAAVLIFLAIWGLDRPRGLGDPRSMIAALWVRGIQAGEEVFALRAPVVALYGSGRIVARRDRSWLEGALGRDELTAFVHRLDGAGLHDLSREFRLEPDVVGTVVADAGEIHVRLSLDGEQWDLYSYVPLVTLRAELKPGDVQERAVAEVMDIVQSLGDRASVLYRGPIAVQVVRVTEIPAGEQAKPWVTDPALRKLSALSVLDEADSELHYDEARLALQALAAGRYFSEDEFFYRMDWRPVLPQRPDQP